MLILVILIGGLGVIWNPYEFFGPGGLTKWPSDDIMLAKTAAPPHISDTFSDTLGHIQYILNNFTHIPYTLNNFSLSVSLYTTQTYIFYYIYYILNNYTKND